MRVLVTGGCGYIGSHAVIELLMAGHEVLVIDNLSTGKKEVLNRIKMIVGLHPDFQEIDVRDEILLTKKLKEFKPQCVIHFSGSKIISKSIENPVFYYDNNVLSTIVLLKVMEKVDCKKIVFSSSATVYGKPNYLPLDESHVTFPLNPYGKTKLFVESILRDWVQTGCDRKAIALRYFNPVGAHPTGLIGEDPTLGTTNLMPVLTSVVSGKLEQFPVYGTDYETRDGTGERDYIHVMDVAAAHCASLSKINKIADFEAINIGTGKGITVLEIINMFENVSGKKIKLDFQKRRNGDLGSCWTSNNKAKELLNWEPSRQLIDMCLDALKWIIENPKGYKLN